MQRLNDVTNTALPTTTDATAISLEGGRAYLADIARRFAPHFTRSQSRQRVMAYLYGLRSELVAGPAQYERSHRADRFYSLYPAGYSPPV